MRSSSMRMSSWSERSSSANSNFNRLRGLVAMADLLLDSVDLRFRQRQRDVELRPVPRAGACGFDLPAVVAHDAIYDRESQAGSLPAPFAGEKRLEQMLEHFVGHAAAIVGEDHFGEFRLSHQLNRKPSAGFEAVERIGDQIQHDLLDFLRINMADDRLAGV